MQFKREDGNAALSFGTIEALLAKPSLVPEISKQDLVDLEDQIAKGIQAQKAAAITVKLSLDRLSALSKSLRLRGDAIHPDSLLEDEMINLAGDLAPGSEPFNVTRSYASAVLIRLALEAQAFATDKSYRLA